MNELTREKKHVTGTPGAGISDRATVRRVEVTSRAHAGDPRGARVKADAGRLGIDVSSVRTSRVYLIKSDMSDERFAEIVDRLLADPVTELATPGASNSRGGARVIEVHPLPGVMDPAAGTVERTLREVFGIEAMVRTGMRYDLVGASEEGARELARRVLANPVIESVHEEPFEPEDFPSLPDVDQRLRHIDIRDLHDAALETMSREKHLFLSLDEMRAIREEYRRRDREPTDIELETLAQTWSEHCVHKTLKSTVKYMPHEGDALDFTNRPGHEVHADGTVTIHNLLKSTVAAATHELIAEGVDWTLSVFVDNAGIIEFDEDNAVCVKVETHNHPSAIEPYGGAATGVGGCIRDIMGTGLAAKPIANTDVFCVANPDMPDADVPGGCLHPRRILTRVVDGVRDYGNRMGIPTVNGAVFFDDRYVGNPLVFVGCVGVMPRDLIDGEAQSGDAIVALGGRTGKDGIHGATFSSAELTDTHADEFSHAVQIGNAIEEKRTLDAILRARDVDGGPLYSAITDCGAGGFSSAVGEMGEKVGATVELDRAPLKYEGLRYDEIWISESQERMVLSVPPEKIERLQAICDEEGVELAVLGEFGAANDAGEAELVLNFEGKEVGRMSMAFLHEGIPMPTREATWSPGEMAKSKMAEGPNEDSGIEHTLLDLLAHPNIASKRWIVRQYDHEVQGNTIVKPLVGEGGDGPGDATVIQPVPGSKKGLAIGCGLQVPMGDREAGGDPYLMALGAIDECVRNLVCVGADPERIAILDNFCWPSCAKPENLGALVRACEGCYDGAKAYRTPFVSGKDSLNNQFRTDDGRLIEIPPTLLITGIGIVPDVDACVTMDAKRAGDALIAIRSDNDGPAVARAVHGLIRGGKVHAAHDISEGGLAVTVAEMLLAAEGLGATIDVDESFFEEVGGYVLEVASGHVNDTLSRLGERAERIGEIDESGSLSVKWETIGVSKLRDAFLGTLDW